MPMRAAPTINHERKSAAYRHRTRQPAGSGASFHSRWNERHGPSLDVRLIPPGRSRTARLVKPKRVGPTPNTVSTRNASPPPRAPECAPRDSRGQSGDRHRNPRSPRTCAAGRQPETRLPTALQAAATDHPPYSPVMQSPVYRSRRPRTTGPARRSTDTVRILPTNSMRSVAPMIFSRSDGFLMSFLAYFCARRCWNGCGAAPVRRP